MKFKEKVEPKESKSEITPAKKAENNENFQQTNSNVVEKKEKYV